MAEAQAALLFRRHHVSVFRFLRGATGSAQQAEDLSQEVFLRVVRALPQYHARDREEAWIFRIAQNVLRDDRRRRGARPSLSPEHAAEDPRSAPFQALQVELDEALRALPEHEREAFLLREIGGLSYEEIAGATQTTPDAVRSRIFRARTALRSALSGSPLTRRPCVSREVRG